MALRKAGLPGMSHLSGKIHIGKVRIVEMEWEDAEHSGDGAGGVEEEMHWQRRTEVMVWLR